MIELIVTACLLSSPAKCKEAVVAHAPPGTRLEVCASQAIPALAKWAGENPGVTIKSWRCAVPSKRGTDA